MTDPDAALGMCLLNAMNAADVLGDLKRVSATPGVGYRFMCGE